MNHIKKIISRVKRIVLGIDFDGKMGGAWIHPSVELKKYGNGRVILAENVRLHKGVRIDVEGEVKVKSGTIINTYTRIESMRLVEIGENVMIAPNVYISDRNHKYQDINIPMKMQGYYSKGNLKIGDGTWIGIHACVIGNVQIGKGCVIGANAVVTKDIPDYCVVVGNPARIVKQYDFNEKKWIKKG